MTPYNHRIIEPKWQQIWSDTGLYRAGNEPGKPSTYVLPMFPYPSGDGLHVGHVRNYTITDMVARFRRMQGANVLHPIGWDAFGLPAENYAIKNGVAPQQSTQANTDAFRTQLQNLGISFDWSRELNSSTPEYYRWTQWIFTMLLRRGLAYQSESEQWWCEHDKTVLANEQVEQGRCWRCGNLVTKKLLKQWFFKITEYADQLLDDLDGLDWPAHIKTMQRNWIGRSAGAEVEFSVAGVSQRITVYTTRPDTLAGATFVVLAPEHPLVSELTTATQSAAVTSYVEEVKRASEIERLATDRKKTGVDTGAVTTNPLTGAEMPIWVADYVLGSYGTGAIMAVPAHDERDFEFARTFKLPMIQVIEPVTGERQIEPERRTSIVAIVRNPKDDTLLSINWGNQGGNIFVGGGVEPGEDLEETARREVAEETGYRHLRLIERSELIHHHYYAHSKGKAREIECTGFYFELEDELRQEPQMEADEVGKFSVEWITPTQARAVVQDQLHRYLFDKFVDGKIWTGRGVLTASGKFDGLEGTEAQHAIVEHLFQTGAGRGATKYRLRDWLISRQRYWGTPIPVIHCPTDGAVAVPEDQLPVVLPPLEDYLPTGDGRSPLAKVRDWVQVSCPKCGGPAERETDTMDTFADSSWYFLRFADPHNDTALFDPEEVSKWLPVDFYEGGAEHAVLHLLYARFWTKVLADEGLLKFREPFKVLRSHGMILGPDNRKMSKSIGNVINPNAIVERYGADSLRLYELFMGPYDQETAWSDERLGGVNRFVHRIWALSQRLIANNSQSGEPHGTFATRIDRAVHLALKKVHDDLRDLRFNTMVAALMELLNTLSEAKTIALLEEPRHAELANRTIRAVVLMLAPAAPHLTEELWQQLGEAQSVHTAAWPAYDPALLREDVISVVVQVNGKLRATIALPADVSEQDMLDQAQTAAERHLSERELIKTITVPRKLVNFVVR